MKKKCILLVLCLLHCAIHANEPVLVNEPVHLTTQVCVIGGGSGGIGAALSAARAGAQVVLIEKQHALGGTSTLGFVNNWEPGVGGRYAYEIYQRMTKIPNAMAITREMYRSHNPSYAMDRIVPEASYYSTLRRSDVNALKIPCGGVVFDADIFDRTVREMLQETQRCTLMLNTSFIKSHTGNKKIVSVECMSAEGTIYTITADVFIDCTGDLLVCRDAGCEYMLGADPKHLFNEPSAPETQNNDLNAISLCYRIRRSQNPEKAETPAGIFNYGFSAVSYDIPGKKDLLSINPLGIMDGNYLIEHGYDSAYLYAKKIVDHHWARLQNHPPFEDYEFDGYAPMLGIRESYRLSGEYILTQNDLLEGYRAQTHGDIIALADHPMDVHGRHTSLGIIKDAYGIPYRCLIPKGWENLLVASRSAGFSQIAASSCRLSRTILSLGHAAGFAAYLASSLKIPVKDVPVARIQAEVNLMLRPKSEPDALPLQINEHIGSISAAGFLFSDNGRDSLFWVSSTGEKTWRCFAKHVQDLQVLDNGHILFSYHYGEQGKGGACEMDKNKEIVFRYEIDGEVHTCQRLKNGNTLIGDNKNGRLLEVNVKGKIVKKIPLRTTNLGHSCMRVARQLDNGNYLVCQEGDQQVVEYNPRGKPLHTIRTAGKCFMAIRLENGHTLVSEGDACTISEYDLQGNPVWRFSGNEYPELKANWFAGLQLLPNGNMLVCNWLGHGHEGEGIPLFELTRDKRITFYYLKNEHLISNVTVGYDTNYPAIK